MDKVILNGEERDLSGPTPLVEFLESMGLGTKWVLVERNGEAILRENYESTLIEPGDRLEIATPMAGG